MIASFSGFWTLWSKPAASGLSFTIYLVNQSKSIFVWYKIPNRKKSVRKSRRGNFVNCVMSREFFGLIRFVFSGEARKCHFHPQISLVKNHSHRTKNGSLICTTKVKPYYRPMLSQRTNNRSFALKIFGSLELLELLNVLEYRNYSQIFKGSYST